ARKYRTRWRRWCAGRSAARRLRHRSSLPGVTDPARRGWVEVGRVERARGLDGHLLVRLHGDDPANLLGAPEVSLRGTPGSVPFRVLEAHDRGRARVELRLAGLATRELARDWAGASVWIADAALRPLPAGEYYQRDLIGLAVRTPDGSRLGH